MFESSLITKLAADGTLTGLLSTFESAPAIFSSVAPQTAEMPYIVFDISSSATDNLGAMGFLVTLDVYNRSASAKELRQIAERIEYVLDRQVLSGDSRFDSIRLFYEYGGEVENPETDVRHYVCEVSARAGRKKWMGTI